MFLRRCWLHLGGLLVCISVQWPSYSSVDQPWGERIHHKFYWTSGACETFSNWHLKLFQCMCNSKHVVLFLNSNFRVQVTAGQCPCYTCCFQFLCGPSLSPRCVSTGLTTLCSPPCPPTWTTSCTLTWNRWVWKSQYRGGMISAD